MYARIWTPTSLEGLWTFSLVSRESSEARVWRRKCWALEAGPRFLCFLRADSGCKAPRLAFSSSGESFASKYQVLSSLGTKKHLLSWALSLSAAVPSQLPLALGHLEGPGLAAVAWGVGRTQEALALHAAQAASAVPGRVLRIRS